ncbi:MAG: GNAT family protein [Cyanobacteria bacterium J06635_1]
MLPSQITRELCLEQLDPRHADAIFRLTDENRDYLRQWLPWVDNVHTAEDTRAFIITTQAQFERNEGFQMAIVWQGNIVGAIGHHRIDWANHSASLGYWLAAPYQGKGMMTQACRVLVNHAFQALNLNRIEIRAATENYRSQAIPRRLGFKQEGIVREGEWLYDHFVDLMIFGLLRSDWQLSS